MKVAELDGALLDYWVAQHDPRCAGLTFEWRGDHWVGIGDVDGQEHVCCVGCAPSFKAKQVIRRLYREFEFFQPSCSWVDGGPIIERHNITLLDPNYCNSGQWEAYMGAFPDVRDDRVVGMVAAGAGPTPLIAAMRAYVASRFADHVPDIEKPL